MTTGAIGREKLQSNHHHQQTNTQLFKAQIPFLSPNRCQITEGKTVPPTVVMTSSLTTHSAVHAAAILELTVLTHQHKLVDVNIESFNIIVGHTLCRSSTVFTGELEKVPQPAELIVAVGVQTEVQLLKTYHRQRSTAVLWCSVL